VLNKHIVEAPLLPNVTVQVLPAGLLAGVHGSFHVAEVDGVSALVAFL